MLITSPINSQYKNTMDFRAEDINHEKYIKTLSKKEYQGYMIAKTHLGSSFDLEKSIGYIKWKQQSIESRKL